MKSSPLASPFSIAATVAFSLPYARAANTVTTTADELDSPAGSSVSLREAVRNTPDGGLIDFAASLSGTTINLTTGAEIELTRSVTIDASGLPAGLTIDGGAGSNRIFFVDAASNVSLKNLTLTGGNGVGAVNSGEGGAVFSNGTLSLQNCIVSANSSPGIDRGGGAIASDYGSSLQLKCCTFSNNATSNEGGAISISGATTISNCTFVGNSASGTLGNGGAISSGGVLSISNSTFSENHAGNEGGAILSVETLNISQSTFTGNSAGDGGGAISSFRNLSLSHCTITNNRALNNNAQGGGIRASGLTAHNTIISGNIVIDGRGHDIFNNGVLTRTGTNIIYDLVNFGSGTASGSASIDAGPQLAPLGNYGGPTQTMALRPGSPARNAATSSTVVADQRGFPVVGAPDIGAYEAGTHSNFSSWSAETTETALGFTADSDNDGTTNGLEYGLRCNPNLSDPQLSPLLSKGSPNVFQFRYRPTATDLRYRVERSEDLSDWSEVYRYDLAAAQITETGIVAEENSATELISIIDYSSGSRLFWRLVVDPVP